MDNFTRGAILSVVMTIIISLVCLFIKFLFDSCATVPEETNKIEYQLQDANGRVIVSCRGDINTIQFCIEKSREVNK